MPQPGISASYSPSVTPPSWNIQNRGQMTWNPTTHNWDNFGMNAAANNAANPFSGWNAGGPVGWQGYVPPISTETMPGSTTGNSGNSPGWVNTPTGTWWSGPGPAPSGTGPGGDLGPVTQGATPNPPTQPSAFTPMQQTQQPFDLSSLMNFLPSFFQNQFQSPFQPQSPDSSVIPGWGWGGP